VIGEPVHPDPERRARKMAAAIPDWQIDLMLFIT
jgi:hypothetical protein